MVYQQSLRQFWRGRVVIEKNATVENNPGHVLEFSLDAGKLFVRVDFANGDRYKVLPEELIVL